MSIQGFPYQYRPAAKIIDPQTGALLGDGIGLILALINRTGKGTGIVPIVSAPLVAAGVSIADALTLVNDWNYVATTAAGSGVGILPLKPGNDIEVWNAGANNLNVYPPSAAAQIDALGVGSPFVLAPGKLRAFQCWTINQFLSFGN